MAGAARRLVCQLVVAGLAATPPVTAGEVVRQYQYRVSWNGIPVARATVTRTDDQGELRQTTRLSALIRTNSFVDLFWSLRAQSIAEADALMLRPRWFVFDRRINGKPELTRIDAEPDGLLVGRYARPGRYRLVEVNNPRALDPMTAVLRALQQPPSAAAPQSYDIFTGEARYRIELRREAVETIRVPAGRFDAVRIVPTIWRVEQDKRDPRVRRVAIWVTQSVPHTLLRIRSEVFIGAVYCDLVELPDEGRGVGLVAEPQAQLQHDPEVGRTLE
ncbi:MAG: DUF3108 domain-containing protein [Deltaproteobacteria bacterium]|nr:DUF3108 domain-containing protein [Deltaproteobacteria bacterium]